MLAMHERDEAAWSAVLSPPAAFASLERAVTEFLELEHDCGCPVCERLSRRREWTVATRWVFLDEDERERWLQAFGLTERAAAVRDCLAASPRDHEGPGFARPLA